MWIIATASHELNHEGGGGHAHQLAGLSYHNYLYDNIRHALGQLQLTGPENSATTPCPLCRHTETSPAHLESITVGFPDHKRLASFRTLSLVFQTSFQYTSLLRPPYMTLNHLIF